MDTLEFYRKFPHRRVKYAHMKELEKCECVSSVIIIAPILNIDGEKWVLWESSWLLMMVFMYAYIPYIPLFRKNSHNTHLSRTFIYQQKKRVKAVVQLLIIDHMHPSVYWSKKTEKEKVHWRICLWNSLMAI